MAWSATRFSDVRKTSIPGLAKVNQTPAPVKRGPTSSTPHKQPVATGTQKIESLKPGYAANIVGIIISKDSPRSIFSKKGTEKHVMSFVVRDSPTCFIHVTCWGTDHLISDLSRSFGIGDVVKISNAQVQEKATDGSDEKFRPFTPVPYTMSLSENHSNMALYEGADMGSYAPLLYIPTKPSSDYYTLEDVLANGQSLSGEHISLLAVVRKIGEAKEITTKTGKHTKRCEVKLFDENCQSFPLILWGGEIVDYSQSWVQMETVLFIADVRINYDDYRSGMVATADSKTIFTNNPDTVEARSLFRFAQTQNFSEDFGQAKDYKDPPLDDIQDIVTLEDIVSKKKTMATAYGTVFAVITKFDIDTDDINHFYKRKCSRCKQLVTLENGYLCSNSDCTLGNNAVMDSTGEITAREPELEFSMVISISDHTGTVSQCRLNAAVMETMTGWKVDDLLNLEPEKRTDIKWQFLLERCKLYVKVQRNLRDEDRLSLRILSCGLAETNQLFKVLGC